MQTERMMRTIRDLIELGPRATGTPGGERAAQYVSDRFSAIGLSDVRQLRVPSYAWKAERCSVALGPAEDALVPPAAIGNRELYRALFAVMRVNEVADLVPRVTVRIDSGLFDEVAPAALTSRPGRVRSTVPPIEAHRGQEPFRPPSSEVVEAVHRNLDWYPRSSGR